MPNLLLVEYRDEVFARLATDLAALGLLVARATSMSEATGRFVRQPSALLVVNADQPGESSWLFAAKLRLTHPQARIWVYMRRPSAFDVAMANFVNVEELIHYEGDLWRLADEIRNRVVDEPSGASSLDNAPRRSGLGNAVA